MAEQILANGLITGSIYVLVTIGFSLTYSVGRFFDMSFGAHVLLGAYTSFVVFHEFNVHPVFAIIFASFMAGLLGLTIEKTIFKTLKKRKAPPLVFFVATLGILIIAQALAVIFFGSDSKVFHSGPYPSFSFFNFRLTSIQIVICLISPLFLIAFSLIFYKTDLGRRMRAISDDRELSNIMGINVERTMQYIFFSGAFLAGLAGVIIGFESTVDPGLGLKAVLWAVVASIIGGIGSLPGAILGAYTLGFLESLSTAVFPGEWKPVIVFLILIAFLLFRAHGILGVKIEKYE